MAYHSLTIKDALKKLDTDDKRGLSSGEAEKRLAQYGHNELPAKPPTPFWKLVLEQFDDQLVKILLAAAVTSFLLAIFEEGEHQLQAFTEPAVIMTILILNAIVGVVQESNAEAAIEALKEYQSENATVTRDGNISVIPAKNLVPGDIITCDVGTKVPADARIIEIISSSLNIDQSALTGESVAVSKDTQEVTKEAAVNQDKKNVLFSGTDVTRGKTRAVVFGTGSNVSSPIFSHLRLHHFIFRLKLERSKKILPKTMIKIKLHFKRSWMSLESYCLRLLWSFALLFG